VYERLVALVKEAFKATLGRRLMTHDEMRTFTVEVEASLNSRPLTFVSTEPDGLQPIRPVDFLNPTAELQMDRIGDVKGRVSATAKGLIQHWQAQQATMDHYWSRFSRDYLLLLREKSKWSHRQGRGTINATPSVGEVVLVEDYRRPRNFWPLGRITELEVRSGAVRNVKVKLQTGQQLMRPVNKIYPLESVLTDDVTSKQKTPPKDNDSKENESPAEKPKSQATKAKAEPKIKKAVAPPTHRYRTRAATRAALGIWHWLSFP